jgi:hypothetical protein
MNLSEDRLRAALLQAGEQIPPSAVPPLELPDDVPGRVRRSRRRPAGHPRRWPAALGAAAAVCLIIGLSVALAGGPGQVAPARPVSLLAQFPPYYVALQQAPGCGPCAPGSASYSTNPDRAVVQSTLTGDTLATIAVPKPYGTFAFVQGTADSRDFILGAQRLSAGPPVAPYPATKLYLLRLNPSARPGHRAQLTALPVPLLPGASGYELVWLAPSPNGDLLATISTSTARNIPATLRVFDLLTGRSRTWVLPKWAQLYQDRAASPSWCSDSRTLAFFDRTTARSAELVLLNTSAPAASFSADSRFVPLPRPPGTDEFAFLPGAPVLTPDSRHVIESVIDPREVTSHGPVDAFALDLVNLRTREVSQMRQHSQIFYVMATDPSGSAVIVDLASLPPYGESFAVWTARAAAPIQLPADTIAVTW